MVNAPAASLWWPGDHRAGDLMSDAALLRALVTVEQSWLDALVAEGVAPTTASQDLGAAAEGLDPEALAIAAESAGSPVTDLVATLRERAGGDTATATWLHRGSTSQDVLDCAVLLCARDAVDRLRAETSAQVDRLAGLAAAHRDTPVVARTLSQHAVPTTFGARVAGWLHAVLDADDALAGLRWPVQAGGAVGTLSALVELAGADRARAVRRRHAERLHLRDSVPWHTTRSTVTALGDAVTTATDTWGRIARDVIELGRPEIGEVRDGSGGASSTMPNKSNPILAVLVRRAALAAPPLAATLHAAAADQVDDRADGAWHVEWQTLAWLLRRAVVAAAQSTALLDGLSVRPDVMAARLGELGDTVLAEQRTMARLAGRDRPTPGYVGLAGDLVDDALERARGRLQPDSLQEGT